ncbi:MAG: DNA polymerase III subunit delta' [Bacteroidaceae bacterium]|nr:DNA polymerase III subunit delta' [Bacteroidaceae bacterium]
MQYNEVIGQEEIKARLRQELKDGRVPHARLFRGPEGCGKLPMALAYATALLCQNPNDGEACGQCSSCRMAAAWAHPDLHFVFPVFKRKGQSGDAVSDQFLKEWREQLKDSLYFDRLSWLARIGIENQQAQIGVGESEQILRKLSIVASQGGRKVMIIWLPELMNLSAANKLLKILEEPPTDTVFLLVAEHAEKMLATILSRTQITDFRQLTQLDLEQILQSRHGLQPEDAAVIAHMSEGSYIKALKQIYLNENEAVFFDMFVLLMRLSYMRKIKEMHQWADQVASWGRERQKNFLEYCQRLVRENFISNFHRKELNYMSRREADFSVKFGRFINERNVIGIMDELSLAQRDIEQNVNAKMVFFDFALKTIMLLKQ